MGENVSPEVGVCKQKWAFTPVLRLSIAIAIRQTFFPSKKRRITGAFGHRKYLHKEFFFFKKKLVVSEMPWKKT